MQNLILSPIDPDILIRKTAEAVAELIKESKPETSNQPKSDTPFDDYIPKSEIAGKYASASTLWHWEKSGKLQAYGIGGKRYYKREDIEKLFIPIK